MSVEIYNAFIKKYGRLPTEKDPQYLELLRMSKYRILSVPDFNPGKCANCGASKDDNRKYVDFGLIVDWYGTVYLCGTCVHDISENFGHFEESKEKLADAQAEIEMLKEKLDQGVTLPENLVKAWEEFKEYYAELHTTGNNIIADSTADVEFVTKEPSRSGTNETKSGTTKPASSPRRSNVSSLTELLNSKRD